MEMDFLLLYDYVEVALRVLFYSGSEVWETPMLRQLL